MHKRSLFLVAALFLVSSLVLLAQASPTAVTRPEIPTHSRNAARGSHPATEPIPPPPNEAQKEYGRFTVNSISQWEAEGLFALSLAQLL